MIDQIHTCSFEGGTILIYNIRKSTAEWLIWFSGKTESDSEKERCQQKCQVEPISSRPHVLKNNNHKQTAKHENQPRTVHQSRRLPRQTRRRQVARFREIYDWCHMPSSFACKHQHISAVPERAKTAAITTSWQERQSQTWINYQSDKAQWVRQPHKTHLTFPHSMQVSFGLSRLRGL